MSGAVLTDRLRATLACFDRRGTPRTTTEVADDLDLGRRSTYGRLERLVEYDRLATKKVGASARVWWRPLSDGASEDAQPAADTSVAAGSLFDVLDSAEVGVFVLDESLAVAWVNDAAERYFGIDRERAIGCDKRRLLDEEIALAVDEPDDFVERLRARYQDNTAAEQFTCRVEPGGGSDSRWLEHRSHPIESGTYAGGRVELYYDITDRTQAERRSQIEQRQFESLIETVEEYAIVALDADGHIQNWNAGAEAIMGYDRSSVFGEHVSMLYTEEQRAAGVPSDALAAAANHGSTEHAGWRVRADGSRFWANTTLTAITDEQGTVSGFTKITRDMTERREHQRQRRQERDLVDQLFETAPIRMAIFQPDGTIERINTQARETLGLEPEDVASFTIDDLDFYDPDGEPLDAADHPVRTVIETGEPVSNQIVQHDGLDGSRRWISLTAAPLFVEDELERILAVAADITDLKRTERQLSRERDSLEQELDDVFDRIDDGVFGLDHDFRFTYINDSALSIQDRPRGELIGRPVVELFPEIVGTEFEAATLRAVRTQEPQTFEAYYEPFDDWFESTIYPSETGLSVYFRDVSERKTRQRELERYETIVETMNDGVYIIGDDGRFQMVNQSYAQMLGYDREELLGAPPTMVASESTVEQARAIRDKLANDECDTARIEDTITTADGDSITAEATFSLIPTDDESFERVGVVRDVSERREREQRLQRRLSHLETIADLGRNALGTHDIDELMADATTTVADQLDADGCAVHEIDESGAPQRRHSVGPSDVVPPDHALGRTESVVSHDEGFSVAIETADDPWGVLTVHDTEQEALEEHDVAFVQSIATVLATALSRHADERALVQQREQLAAVNSLNSVVNEIAGAVIDQPTRDEIESTVCRLLAGSDSYAFAWIGEPDFDSQTIMSRAVAGVDGYFDGAPITVDPDGEHRFGPTGSAFQTNSVQTRQNLQTDPEYEPWRDILHDHDVHASAAIPIAHHDTVYGVLNVYTQRPDAFEDEERAVIERLGEIVGYAIAATDRKRALMSDDVVELEFYVRDIFESLSIDQMPDHITFDTAFPVGDEFLVYGSVADGTVDALAELEAAISHWTNVRALGERGSNFELRVDESRVFSVLASLGGRIDQAVIDGDDYHLRLHLAPETDVAPLIDAVTETYPNAELTRRRQRSFSRDSVAVLDRVLADDLTDRQRLALETAFQAGFFEWPRESSGEQLAEVLDVSPPTFHQHLRKAERKLLQSVLSRDGDE